MENKCNILFCDDELFILNTLKRTFIYNNDFIIYTACSGKDALRILQEHPIDIIITDYLMPQMNGNELLGIVKEKYPDILRFILTGQADLNAAIQSINEIQVYHYLTKPWNDQDLKLILHKANDYLNLKQKNKNMQVFIQNQNIKLKELNLKLETKVRNRTKEINLTRKALIIALASLAETRDPETGAHLLRTQKYTGLLARKMRLKPKFKNVIDQNFVNHIFDCTPLHDIGKVGIPDGILLKKDKLTTEEFEIMKKHTIIGKKILESTFTILGEIPFLKIAAEIAVSHHERFDGKGYPYGLSDENIPLSGRIMALADIFDALANQRIYKPAWSEKAVNNYILEQRGHQLDPDVVDVFFEIKEQFNIINRKYQDTEKGGN